MLKGSVGCMEAELLVLAWNVQQSCQAPDGPHVGMGVGICSQGCLDQCHSVADLQGRVLCLSDAFAAQYFNCQAVPRGLQLCSPGPALSGCLTCTASV